jgi:hypothetical protein
MTDALKDVPAKCPMCGKKMAQSDLLEHALYHCRGGKR